MNRYARVVEVRTLAWLSRSFEVDVRAMTTDPLAPCTRFEVDVESAELAPSAFEAAYRVLEGATSEATLDGVIVTRNELDSLDAQFAHKRRISEITGLLDPTIQEGAVRITSRGTLTLRIDVAEPPPPVFVAYRTSPAVAGEISFPAALRLATAAYCVDLTKTRETARWWFFKHRQIGCYGAIVDRPTGRVSLVGSGLGRDLEALLEEYDANGGSFAVERPGR
jgi:hypothetical protein